MDKTVDELAPLPDALNARRIHGFELVAAAQRLFAELLRGLEEAEGDLP